MGRIANVVTSCLFFALLPLAGVSAKSERVTAAAPLETVSVLTLDGQIVIEPDGQVSDVVVDTKLTASLAAMVKRHVLAWRFKPLTFDGAARQVKSLMHMGLAAADEHGKYRVWVDSVTFPEIAGSVVHHVDGEPEPISAGETRPPIYPAELQSRGFMVTALLAIRVTADGKAGDVVAVQSMYCGFNQPKWPSPKALKMLESNAINSARHWTFIVPGGSARVPDRMTVTVQYSMGYDLNTPGV